jgi:uncharacterized protein (UPF0333 family)
MLTESLQIFKVSALILILVLAIIGALYVLGIFESESAKSIARTIIILTGIGAGASVLILIVNSLGKSN